MVDACEKNYSAKTKKNTKQLLWWNQNLDKMRTNVLKEFHKVKMERELVSLSCEVDLQYNESKPKA